MKKNNDSKYNRLSEALRQNLLKRKEQQRSRLRNKDISDFNPPPEKADNKNEIPPLKEQGEKE